LRATIVSQLSYATGAARPDDRQLQRAAVNRAGAEDADGIAVRARVERQPRTGVDRRDDRAARIDRGRGFSLRRRRHRRGREVHEQGSEREEGSHDEEIGKGEPPF